MKNVLLIPLSVQDPLTYGKPQDIGNLVRPVSEQAGAHLGAPATCDAVAIRLVSRLDKHRG